MNFITTLFKHHIVRYIFSGGTGAITNLALLYFLTEVVGFYYIISGIIAFCGAVVVSFFMQKKWTFQDHSTEDTHKKFAIFVTIAFINLVINTGLLYLFTDIFHSHYLLSQIFVSGIVAVWSYFIYKVVFRTGVGYDTPHEKDHD